MLNIYHVTKRFRDGTTALSDINFRVKRGEFVFITGASGAGKSTLINLILAKELPTEGQIIINKSNLGKSSKQEIQSIRRTIGVVFQNFKLIEKMTVYENVEFGLHSRGYVKSDVKKKALSALQSVGLTHRLNHKPEQLSGGEKQRVAIARAIISEPLLLMADEPTGNLDPAMAREIMEIFKNINGKGTTIIVASHDKALISQMNKRVITLERGVMIS